MMLTELVSRGRIAIGIITLKMNGIVSGVMALILASLFLLTGSCAAQTSSRIVHVFVALADNQHQGIVPVPAALGNERHPQGNGAPSSTRNVVFAQRAGSLLRDGTPSRTPPPRPSTNNTY